MNNPVIPAEAVEAAARLHYDSSPTHRATWVQLSVGYRRELMEPMRAALEAAAPHIRAALADSRDGELFRFTLAQREWLRGGAK